MGTVRQHRLSIPSLSDVREEPSHPRIAVEGPTDRPDRDLLQELAGPGRGVVPVDRGETGHGRGHVPRQGGLEEVHGHRGQPHQGFPGTGGASGTGGACEGAAPPFLRQPEHRQRRDIGKHHGLLHGGMQGADRQEEEGHAVPSLQVRRDRGVRGVRPRHRRQDNLRVRQLLPRHHRRQLLLQVEVHPRE